MIYQRMLATILISATTLSLGCASSDQGDIAPRAESSITPKIVGGTKSPASQDFVFIIVNMVDTGGLECTAVLIAPNVALTARHCVSPQTHNVHECEADGKSQNLGTYGPTLDPSHFTLSQDPYMEHTSDVKVGKIFTHEGEDVCGGKDIAVLLLDRPFGADPTTIRKTPAVVGETITVVGYGMEHTDAEYLTTKRLQREGVEVLGLGPMIVPNDAASPRVVSDGEFLASVGFCQGDSGGPALDADGKVIGLVSRLASHTCEEGPDIYTGLMPSLDLIRNALIEGGNDPGDTSEPDAGGASEAPATDDGSSGCTTARVPARGAEWIGLAFATCAAVVGVRRRRSRSKH